MAIQNSKSRTARIAVMEQATSLRPLTVDDLRDEYGPFPELSKSEKEVKSKIRWHVAEIAALLELKPNNIGED